MEPKIGRPAEAARFFFAPFWIARIFAANSPAMIACRRREAATVWGMEISKRGLAASLIANVIFGFIYMFSKLLEPLSGTEVFVWRVVFMWASMMLLAALTRNGRNCLNFLMRLKRDKALAGAYVVTAPIVAFEMWLFMWAPVNDYGMDCALGYFILPLFEIFLGKAVFKETLNKFTRAAVALAFAAVCWQIAGSRAISWVTFAVFLGYGAFFAIRRRFFIPNIEALALDMTLMLPFACATIAATPGLIDAPFASSYALTMFLLLGASSALAMQLVMVSSKLLPVTIFGLLSYVEPCILLIVALLFLGGSIAPREAVTYALIFGAIAMVALDGAAALLRMRKTAEIGARLRKRRAQGPN